VSRSELVDLLWGASEPPSCDTALSAVVSKLRTLLSRAGLDGARALSAAGGCYELRLPAGTWIDTEAAADAVHAAEAALKSGDLAAAYGPSAVAHHIARRPFLGGEEGPWVDARRARLRGILLRALECRAEVYLWNHEHTLAAEAARELVALEPFREAGYRLLMRAHAAAGNSGEALWTYEQCRRLMTRELGVGPSRETRAVHDAVLAAM
jgi:SARP family transcriptional regulator, regulator of embCAB operon